MGPGVWEVLVIFLVIIIFFGAKKIPELARNLALGLREFKKATSEIKDELKDTADDIKQVANEDEK